MRLLDLLERKKQEQKYAYHGTTSLRVPSILKHGLQPDHPDKVYSGDDDGDDPDASLQTMGGVYMTRRESIALNHARNAVDRFGGDPVVVKIIYTVGSERMDEDDFYTWVTQVITSNPRAKGYTDRNKSDEEISDMVEDIRMNDSNVKEFILSNFRETFQVSRDTNVDIVWDIIRTAATSDQKFMEYSSYDSMRWIRSLYDLDQEVWKHVRSMIQQIIEKTKKPLVNRGDWTHRITRPIGFRGKTRIVKITKHLQWEDIVLYQDNSVNEAAPVYEGDSMMRLTTAILLDIERVVSEKFSDSAQFTLGSLNAGEEKYLEIDRFSDSGNNYSDHFKLGVVTSDGTDGFDKTIVVDKSASKPDVYRSLVRTGIRAVEDFLRPDGIIESDIPSIVEPNFGMRIGQSYKFYRGINKTSGSNGATYGRGLYTTTNRKYASEYGSVVEIPRWEALPDNPIRFTTVNDWQIWLHRFDQYNGLSVRERNVKFPNIDEYIRSVWPDVDGVQIGTGRDAIFVAWEV